MATTIDDPEALQQTLDMWVQDLNSLFAKVKEWSEKQGWATLLDDKKLREKDLGTYDAPVLLIHTPKGRLLLDPYARFVFDGEGAVDVCEYPSFGTPVHLVRRNGVWSIRDTRGSDDSARAFQESSFVDMVKELQQTP